MEFALRTPERRTGVGVYAQIYAVTSSWPRALWREALHLINDDLQLDTHVGYGLNGRERDYFLGLGLAARW